MARFQVSANAQVGIGVAVALLTLGSKGAIQLPVGIPTTWGPIVTSWSNFIMQIYVVVAPILAAYSSSEPGMFAPPDPPTVKAATAAAAKVAGVLLVALLAVGLLALPAPQARAAGREGPSTPPVATGPIIDPLGLNKTTGATTAVAAAANGPLAELAELFASDFASAVALATATSIQDGNGQACWKAFSPFGELVKAHPNVFSGKLATDLEAQRLIVIAARNLCNNVACSTVFTELATAVSKITTALPLSINVNVTPVNVFAKACADVPTIQVIAPTFTAGTPSDGATTTSTPTPTPTGE